MEFTSILNIISLAAAIFTTLALLIAVYQVRESSKQAKEIDRISGSLTTRYVGDYPEYNDALIELMESASKEIHVLVTTLVAGILTDGVRWTRYRQIMDKKLRDGVSVSITYSDSEHTTKQMDKDLDSVQRTWDEWKSRPDDTKHLPKFLAEHSEGLAPDEMTFDDLRNLLLELAENAKGRWFALADAKRIAAVPAIWFWIVDDAAAFFVIPTIPEVSTGQGFLTRDGRLIDALRQIGIQYLSAA